MTDRRDRLYELLPAIYRLRDADQGYQLKALLRVISEQANALEDDIGQLYKNWFIETCQDWVVPYIGDLVGYRQVHEAGELADSSTLQGREHNKILIPRREVGRTIYYRRRKGTLALLEELSNDIAGWPARAAEFYKLLSFTQSINHLRFDKGKTVDLRNMDDLDLLNGPFDKLAHTVDIRRPNSHQGQGRFNIPSIGLFVWPLRCYTETRTIARCLETEHTQRYTFSPLGNDMQLIAKPEREPGPAHIAEEFNLPTPIRRLDFEKNMTKYYGPDRSLQIWINDPWQPVNEEEIIAANLEDWQYEPEEGELAVDPLLGRIIFPLEQMPTRVMVSYHYAFSADMGGGEYDRRIPEPPMISICTLHTEDIKDKASLLKGLMDASEPSKYIYGCFSARTKELLQGNEEFLKTGIKIDKNLMDITINAILDELNGILLDEELYDYERFEYFSLLDDSSLGESNLDKSLQKELDALIKLKWAGKSLQKNQLIRLNRLLLEAIYPISMSYHLYRVGSIEDFKSINEALHSWEKDKPRFAVIEINDSELYQESFKPIKLRPNQNLQLRAANLKRPIIDLPERHRGAADLLTFEGSKGSRLVIDGLTIAGLGVKFANDFSGIDLRHTSLVPGYNLFPHCKGLHHGPSPSIILSKLRVDGKVSISSCITGPIETETDMSKWSDPIKLEISDSILDTWSHSSKKMSPDVLYETKSKVANAALTVRRCTVKGRVRVHAVELAEDSIFDGEVEVARSQWGCMRFCYVEPGSYTPKRFNCQPDLAKRKIKEKVLASIKSQTNLSQDELERLNKSIEEAQEADSLRVRPKFNCTQYGKAAYCQLSDACAEEITRGSEDRSEMGVFHDLFNPQREANLCARLREYTPASMDAGIFYMNIIEENAEEEHEG
jgi:hypothetical protein